ncbi:MAG: asparaginase [Promethearchaeota archaeon]
MKKKKILLIGTGGTITAKQIDGTWKPGEISEADLIQFVPELATIADIATLNLFNIDSVCMQPKYWIKIAQTIKENYKKYDSFVITHGTDTMHYTAAALSFLIKNLAKTVAITGSMVPSHQIGTDAKNNLLNAIRVAVDGNIHEVVIVFNHKIIRGNRAKKIRELEFDAYMSVGMRPLGVIEEDIRYTGEHYHIGDPQKELVIYPNMELEVSIQKLTPGYNPEILKKMAEIGYKGIICEGFGSGNIPIKTFSLLETIEELTQKGIPIIVCSQCAIGFSWMYLYEAGKKAMEAGAIPGYDMTSESAMVKLMWILGNFPDYNMNQIRELIHKDISGEISAITSTKQKRIWE